MLRIQTPGAAQLLARLFELTSPPQLSVDETVTPVVVVGDEHADRPSLDYAPTAAVASLNPLLYAADREVGAAIGVTGYVALINPTGGVLVVTSTRVSSAVAQEWRLTLIRAPHGLGAAVGDARLRDTRPAVARDRLVDAIAASAAANAPATIPISRARTTAGTTYQFDDTLVLAPQSAALVFPIATNTTFSVTYTAELYL